MITVKDIAKLANVSQGTVSNVLNNRGNVSTDKIKRVMAAVKELGYVANAQAKQLRCEVSLSQNIAVILPNIDEERYSNFFNGIKLIIEENTYNPLLYVTDDSLYKEEQIAKRVAEMRVSGIITVTGSISNTDIYKNARNSGSKIMYAFREVLHADNFIGFDYRKVGNDIGHYILGKNYHNVAVISDPEYYPENREFISGLREIIQGSSPPCRLQIKNADWLNISVTPFGFFEGTAQPPDVVVLTNTYFLPRVQLAFNVASSDKCPPIILLSDDSIAKYDDNVVIYYLEYLKCGMKAAEMLISQIFQKQKSTYSASPLKEIITPIGFRSPIFNFSNYSQPATLKILISKSQSYVALQRIISKFTSQTGIKVEFTEVLPSDLFSETIRTANTGDFDLVRNNMSCLPLFDEDIFYTFSKDEFRQITEGMLPKVIDNFSYICGKEQCIPFDIGIDMLVYRKDLFEDQLLQRLYFEQNGQTLSVPKTFDEFEKVIKFFSRNTNPHSPVQAGSGMNWDSPTELSSEFFLRYINYIDKSKIISRELAADEESVYQTLSNMYLCGKYSLPVREKNWIGATLENFIYGHTALEIVFLNYASNIVHLQKNIYGGQVGYTTVPGGISYMTGGSFSIFKASSKIGAAKEFLKWISTYPQTELLTLYGGLSPNRDIYKKSEILLQYPWYSHLFENLDCAVGKELGEVFDTNRIALLSNPILQSIVQGQKDPKDALSDMMKILKTSLTPLKHIEAEK